MSVGWVPRSVDVSVLVTGSGSGSVVVIVSQGVFEGEVDETFDTVTEGTSSENETPGVGSEEAGVSVVV